MCFFVAMFIRLQGDKTAGILHAPMSKSIEAFAIASKISYIVIFTDAIILIGNNFLVARYITKFTENEQSFKREECHHRNVLWTAT